MEYGKTFADRLAYAMKLRKMKASELSDRTGLSRPLISQYLSGKFEAKNDKAYLLGQALDVNPLWLLGFSDNMTISAVPSPKKSKPVKKSTAVSIPLYGPICCGNGGFVDDNLIEMISLPADLLNPHKDYFAQRAQGDSMINAHIRDGDILVFEKSSHIENGQIGCFCLDDNEAVCKRYRVLQGGQICLMPENDKYPPILIDVTFQNFRCIGLLVVNIENMEGR